jgi:hypothetical protein
VSSAHLFDGCLQVPSEEWPLQVALIADGYVPDHLAIAGEDSVGVRKLGTAIEAEIHVVGIGCDVAKPILEP